MPEGSVIVDSGPLVAFLNSADSLHDWAVEQFRLLRAPFLTCEPVLTETFHLLHRLRHGPQRFFELLAGDLLQVEFNMLAERRSLARLVTKYADLPMSLADACLVRMAERNTGACVFTVGRQFRIYRKNGRQMIPTIMPPGR